MPSLASHLTRRRQERKADTTGPRRFVGFNVFQAAVEPHMPRQAHVLVVGNGLSLLAEDLVRAGWRDVCAIDYSDTCTQVSE